MSEKKNPVSAAAEKVVEKVEEAVLPAHEIPDDPRVRARRRRQLTVEGQGQARHHPHITPRRYGVACWGGRGGGGRGQRVSTSGGHQRTSACEACAGQNAKDRCSARGGPQAHSMRWARAWRTNKDLHLFVAHGGSR